MEFETNQVLTALFPWYDQATRKTLPEIRTKKARTVEWYQHIMQNWDCFHLSQGLNSCIHRTQMTQMTPNDPIFWRIFSPCCENIYIGISKTIVFQQGRVKPRRLGRKNKGFENSSHWGKRGKKKRVPWESVRFPLPNWWDICFFSLSTGMFSDPWNWDLKKNPRSFITSGFFHFRFFLIYPPVN